MKIGAGKVGKVGKVAKFVFLLRWIDSDYEDE